MIRTRIGSLLHTRLGEMIKLSSGWDISDRGGGGGGDGGGGTICKRDLSLLPGSWRRRLTV